MHLKQVFILPQKFPTQEHYPFNLGCFNLRRPVMLVPICRLGLSVLWGLARLFGSLGR